MAQFGTAAGPNLYQFALTASAVMGAVGANPSRQGLTIQNNSGQIVTFTFGTTVPVSAATGVQIPANTSTTIPASGMGTLGNLGAQLNLISATAGPNNCTVLEYY